MAVNKNIFFREATLRICGRLDLKKAMENTLAYIKKVIPADALHIGLFDPATSMSRTIVRICPDHWPKVPRSFPIPEAAVPRVAEEWRPDFSFGILNDAKEEEACIQELIRIFWPENVSVLRTRLIMESRMIGMLLLAAEGCNRYDESHAELMGMLNEPFSIALTNALQYEEIVRLKEMLEEDNRYLHKELRHISGDRIIGADFGLKEVMQMVRQVAPLESPVLLLGETGTGKELLANALHAASPRNGGPFVKVNCGGLPEGLIDSELFGHEKGAFTGALALKRGRFERADGGTLFLDEVAELPLSAQVRLLRVLQNREIERVGGTETIAVNVRIISATHRNLEQMVKEGSFREDLWFRLNVFPIMIPPLRQRSQDIPALLEYLVARKCKEMKITRKVHIPAGTMEFLRQHSWPGNIRELQNLVERGLIQSQTRGFHSGLLVLDMPRIPSLTKAEKHLNTSDAPFLSFDDAAGRHIRKALEKTHGKIMGEDGAAALLGLHPSTLRGKMRKLGILKKEI
ncbi:sigma 54-interacting transcriptional regulator [Desulfobotulus alkaliphilus]|uniref:sigma 54-interacting transcriptional regulator n=1 Tax=Desulfobotulus alkaliphilus TaxID=622671 RepID=UPI001C942539|nr:sigma 54-interacting transcriptional regulator [Desulfobotulus alkaliphilus]